MITFDTNEQKKTVKNSVEKQKNKNKDQKSIFRPYFFD